MAVTTPAHRVPGHGTDMLGQRYAYDLLRADGRRGVPGGLLLLSDTGIWTLRTGLILAIVALTVTRLVLVLWGLRGSATTHGQKAGYLLLQLAAVGGVVLLKVAVH